MSFRTSLLTRRSVACSLLLVLCLAWVTQAVAVTLTFDEVIAGETSFEFDADADTVADAIFTTTDPLGFNTVGPGENMSYIQEPGLEGTNLLTPDLRVDFPNGALTSLGFGFAMSAGDESANLTVTFRVYDAGDAIIASATELAAFTEPVPLTPSNFPEGLVSVNFAGTASYATFDFDSTEADRYIIDNFEGTFGSTEVEPPEPPVTPPRPTMPQVPIPTLSEWGLILTIFGVLLLASRRLRRL